MAEIENAHLLEDVFGRWPSFHDAEVLRIVLDRGNVETLPTLEAQIHAFEMTSEIKDGAYVLKNHVLVTFRFLEIDGITLEGFNHQNALFGLSIKDISGSQLERLKFEVRFDGSWGVDVHFRCHSVKVIGVEPFSI